MITQARTWNKTPSLNTGRTKFDLSHERRLTADMFYLYPILVEDCIPGDNWKIGNEIVCRLQPMVAPLMHEINIFVHYYFVPKRIVWEDWEDYIFGGVDGTFAATIPKVNFNSTNTTNWSIPAAKPGGLLDHLYGLQRTNPGTLPKFWPDALYLRAYNFIWNEYYRSQDFQNEADQDDWGQVGSPRQATGGLHVRSWAKDYFTTMMPSTQRGTPLSIPLVVGPTGFGGFKWISSASGNVVGNGLIATQGAASAAGANSPLTNLSTTSSIPISVGLQAKASLDTAQIGTFNVTDLRWIVQAQLWMELAQRGGVRYTEGLQAFFGVHPKDERLDRPEYIGGTKTPIIISEVLQTSVPTETGSTGANPNGRTPLGTMAGHGLSADKSFVTNYYVKEHGMILGLMSIMPKQMYSNGQERFFQRKNKYEHYWPQFRNLSEQGVYEYELQQYTGATMPTEADYNYWNGLIPGGTNNTLYTPRVVGYQGRYDEYRWRKSSIHGEFLQTLNYWHMARVFNTEVYLNETFLVPTAEERDALKRPFAVRTVNEFLISFGNRLHVTRPLPWMSNPGLVDHA